MRSCQLIKDLTQQMALLSAAAMPRVCCSHTTVHASEARTTFLLFSFYLFFLSEGNPKPVSPKLGRQKISGKWAEEENHSSGTPCVSCPPMDAQQPYMHLLSVKQLLASHRPHPSYCGNPPVCCYHTACVPPLLHLPDAKQRTPPCSQSGQQQQCFATHLYMGRGKSPSTQAGRTEKQERGFNRW